MKKTLSFLSFIVTVMFIVCVIVTYLYPNILKTINISSVVANTIIMNLISMMLLLSFLQVQLSLSWRVFSLLCSFIILIESILMLGAWQQIFK